MLETDKIDLLLELFGWDTTPASRYSALLILRKARREECPTYDDFLVGRV